MKKNPIEDIINKIIWTKKDAKIIVEDRMIKEKIKIIDSGDIMKAGTDFLFLKDGTMIPYHRIIEIKIGDNIEYKRSDK